MDLKDGIIMEPEENGIIPSVTQETINAITELYPEDISGVEEKIDWFYEAQPFLARAIQNAVGQIIDCNREPAKFVRMIALFIQSYSAIEAQVFERDMS
jgi:hypothetical protein